MKINVLTIFDYYNEEDLRQFALDFLTDGAIIINTEGYVVASGVTVLDLKKGTKNGGKKSAAASSAAQVHAQHAHTYTVQGSPRGVPVASGRAGTTWGVRRWTGASTTSAMYSSSRIACCVQR